MWILLRVTHLVKNWIEWTICNQFSPFQYTPTTAVLCFPQLFCYFYQKVDLLNVKQRAMKYSYIIFLMILSSVKFSIFQLFLHHCVLYLLTCKFIFVAVHFCGSLTKLVIWALQEENERTTKAFHAIIKTAPFSVISGSLYFILKSHVVL